jgi:hypothetical protein
MIKCLSIDFSRFRSLLTFAHGMYQPNHRLMENLSHPSMEKKLF